MSTLDEMIECFDEQTRGIDNIKPDGFAETWNRRMSNKREKLHKGLELLERCYFDLWD